LPNKAKTGAKGSKIFSSAGIISKNLIVFDKSDEKHLPDPDNELFIRNYALLIIPNIPK
jgi:hypothetical protein